MGQPDKSYVNCALPILFFLKAFLHRNLNKYFNHHICLSFHRRRALRHVTPNGYFQVIMYFNKLKLNGQNCFFFEQNQVKLCDSENFLPNALMQMCQIGYTQSRFSILSISNMEKIGYFEHGQDWLSFMGNNKKVYCMDY